ncbi:MAG: hypothetical protein ACFFC7_26570 [Candidatus Hermodarchaeota archaeon]
MLTKICFSFFDPIIGPVPVWHPGISPSFARRLALQAHLTIASTADLKKRGTDGVLPFPQQDMIAYVYLFQPVSKFKEREVVALSLIVGQEDQDQLYSNISSFRQEAENIAEKINNIVTSLPEQDNLLVMYQKTVLTTSLRRSLKEWPDKVLAPPLGDNPLEVEAQTPPGTPVMVLPGIEMLNPELRATDLSRKDSEIISKAAAGEISPVLEPVSNKSDLNTLERIKRTFWAYGSQDARVKALLLLVEADRPMTADSLAKATGQNLLLFRRWLTKMGQMKILKYENDVVELIIP